MGLRGTSDRQSAPALLRRGQLLEQGGGQVLVVAFVEREHHVFEAGLQLLVVGGVLLGRLLRMDVDPEVAVVLHQRPLYDDRAFPEVLHEHAVVHVLRDFAADHLDAHGELLEEVVGVLHQIHWLFWAPAEDAAALVALHDAVVQLEGSVEKVSAKAAL